MKARIGYALAAVALFAVEAFIAVFVHDAVVRPYLGDALVVALMYLVLRAVTPLSVHGAAGAAFGIACVVEVGQYLHLIDRLGLARSGLARAVLGTYFDPRDFVSYALGAAGVLIVERLRAGHWGG